MPGDKSISHRAAILGAIAHGQTTIGGFLAAQDTLNTASALAKMGVHLEGLGTPQMLVHGVGLRGLQAPDGPIDLGNSGTGMRLLMGVLAGQPFVATLVGDESLSRRPMDRIAAPLKLMGISVAGQGDKLTPPVTVRGGTPRAIGYHSPIASAQVKSAVLLAGLYAAGATSVIEPAASRDHTERMLSAFGAAVTIDGLRVSLQGAPDLRGRSIRVPGDFSSAAYFIGAALLCPQSEVVVEGILLNPTRAALIPVLRRMGADIRLHDVTDQAGEAVGAVTARSSGLTGTVVAGGEIPCLIDEIPLLAVIASQAEGITEIRDAAELRVKESDRLATTARGLRAMGADVTELPDGFVIRGPKQLAAARIAAEHDHRIAMSFAVAALVARGRTAISGAQYIRTSFPGFAGALRSLGADVREACN